MFFFSILITALYSSRCVCPSFLNDLFTRVDAVEIPEHCPCRLELLPRLWILVAQWTDRHLREHVALAQVRAHRRVGQVVLFLLGVVDLILDLVVVQLEVEFVVGPPEPDRVGLRPGQTSPARPDCDGRGRRGSPSRGRIQLVDPEQECLARRCVEGGRVSHKHGQNIQVLEWKMKVQSLNHCFLLFFL